jgi:hypothetical protein
MKTLTLITITVAAAITSVLSAENDNAGGSPSNIYVNNERAEKQLNVTYRYKPVPYGTREIRIVRGEQKQRENGMKTAEFAELSDRVRTRIEAKFGGPTEASKQLAAIKYDCYYHASEFCRRYNESDTATRAYEMQEYVMAGLEEKATKIANKSNTLANTLAKN